jgi:subtilase family serine protease
MASRVTALKRGVSGLAALCLGAGMMVVGSPADAATPAGRAFFPGSVPTFVSAATDAGPAANTTVEGEIYLPLRDTIGAQAFATAVSTPGNRLYGKYLSPQAWIAKYSPTRADFNAVKKYLVDSGETVYATPASRQYIVFRGPAATTVPAFGTALRNYRVQGKIVSAPSSAPSVPTALSGKVVAISLGNARAQLTRPNNAEKVASTATSSPKAASTAKVNAAAPARTADAAAVPSCSNYWAQYLMTVPLAYGQTTAPITPCGYLPAQLRSAANINKQINAGYDGSGQTIAIVDAYASPTIQQDTNDYMRTVGSPLLTKFQQLDPGTFQDQALCQEPSGWQAEEAIDVQSAHAVAPGAKILYSGGFNCIGGLDIAVSKILDHKLANIISNSYGDTETNYSDGQIIGETDIDAQAAGEGIGLYYSSGDAGDNAASVGFPTSSFISTLATSVGGTTQGIGARGNTVVQVGWGTSLDQFKNGAYLAPLPGGFVFGAGGGPSTKQFQPAYQKGVVPVALATDPSGDKVRVQPDISDLADPETGFQIALRPITDDTTLATGPLQYDTYGGTSLASPIVAAKVALAQQLGHTTIGFANPLLYHAARTKSTAVMDVTPQATPLIGYTRGKSTGNDYLFTFDQDTSLTTQKGYDDVTGVGTVNVGALGAFASAAKH